MFASTQMYKFVENIFYLFFIFYFFFKSNHKIINDLYFNLLLFLIILFFQPEKDEEDFGTFDIPIFTEEFLDHNKSKIYFVFIVMKCWLLWGWRNPVIIIIIRDDSGIGAIEFWSFIKLSSIWLTDFRLLVIPAITKWSPILVLNNLSIALLISFSYLSRLV